MSESEISKNVAIYLQTAYPSADYRFDLAADLKLTMGQAVRHKALHPKRAWPDLFIAEPKRGRSGLFIEMKKSGTKLLRDKDAVKFLKGDIKKRFVGDWFDLHIEEQAQRLKVLHQKGYYATFGCGYSEIVEIIDWYLGKTNRIPERPEAKQADVIRSNQRNSEEVF